MTSLLARLRLSTAPLHQAIERVPLSIATVEERVSRATYAVQLSQLHALHRSLEARLLSLAENETIARVFAPWLCRAEVAASDLRALGAGEPGPVISETVALTDRLLGRADAEPESLAGAVYVLEGSRMGSTQVGKHLAGSLGLPLEPGRGLDYHLRRRAELSSDFKRMVAGLEAVDPRHHEAVVASAVDTFEGMLALYQAIGG